MTRPEFPLVTRRELALAMDWNVTTISLMEAREGLPVEVQGGPGKFTIYSLPKVVVWRVNRELTKRLPDQPSGAPGPLDLDTERARLANVHTRKAELALQRLEGEVAPVGEMAAVVTEILESVKTRMLAMPAGLAAQIASIAALEGPRGVERTLREAVAAALRELSAWRPQQAKGAA